MKGIAKVFILAMSISAGTTQTVLADEQTANTLQELYAQFNVCMGPLPLHTGTGMSIRFSLRRDGSLIGTPKVTYLRAPEGRAARNDDLRTVAESFAHCLPAKITTALGGAIAGRLFTFSYLPKTHEQNA